MNIRNNLLIVIALLVLIVLSGANLLLLLKGDGASAIDQTALSSQTPTVDPIFVKIGPLTVNLRSDRYGERLLYTTLSLRAENEDTRDRVNQYMPEVQNRLLMVISSHTAEQITTTEGKQGLARDILSALEPPLAEAQAPLAISAVLFTDFIVQ